MKTVGTINEILDLFYNRVDDISIHTKHTVANGKYGYELKDGILYCRGKQIGVCNKFVPFVIILHDIEDYLYRPLVKLKNQKIRGKINVDIYNICRENTNIIYNDIHSILSALWYGVNQNLTVTRHILEKDVTNQKFADVRTHQIKYNNARKAWRSALKDILSICKAQGIDANNIINKAYTLYNTCVEYKGFRKIYNTLSIMMNADIEVRNAGQLQSYDKQYEELEATRDHNSSTEYEFLKYLYEHKLRLPDKAQPMFPEKYYVQPDFIYGDRIVVFCDGTPHDLPEVQEDDRKKREVLEDAGYVVIVWYYKTPLAEFVSAHSDIFTPIS